jgi:hypothetical protein
MNFDCYGRRLKRHEVAFVTVPVVWLLLVVMLAAATVAPVCSKFMARTILVPVKNTVSRHTAKAWAAWRVGHPNWKPNAKKIRPRYSVTAQRVGGWVSCDCETILADITVADADLATYPLAVMDLRDFASLSHAISDNTMIPGNPIPAILIQSPVLSTISTVVTSPPIPLGVTSEPSSLWLIGTALLALPLWQKLRHKPLAGRADVSELVAQGSLAPAISSRRSLS